MMARLDTASRKGADMGTILYTHAACLEHDPGRAHPECPARLTAVLAALFMVTSLTLAILANDTQERGSILDRNQPAPANQQQGPSVPGMPSLIPVPDEPKPSQ